MRSKGGARLRAEAIVNAIRSNTCPYCGGPYTLADGGCRDRCTSSEYIKQLIHEAAEAEDIWTPEQLEAAASPGESRR